MFLVSKMNYNEILKGLRTNAKLTQEQLANILEINRVQYNQYENNYNTIPLKHLNKLSNYFNVSIDYLLGLSKKIQYENIMKEINPNKSWQRLKEFRKENKITQDKIAKILNTNQSVIANYERGRTVIATPFLYTICKKYNISADYLLGKIDEKITFK